MCLLGLCGYLHFGYSLEYHWNVYCWDPFRRWTITNSHTGLVIISQWHTASIFDGDWPEYNLTTQWSTYHGGWGWGWGVGGSGGWGGWLGINSSEGGLRRTVSAALILLVQASPAFAADGLGLMSNDLGFYLPWPVSWVALNLRLSASQPDWLSQCKGAVLIRVGVLIVEIRHSYNHVIHIMGFALLLWWHLYGGMEADLARSLT